MNVRLNTTPFSSYRSMMSGDSHAQMSAAQLRARQALDAADDRNIQEQKKTDVFQGLSDIADLAPGSLESQFARTISKALSKVNSETLATSGASTALMMIQGGISGPLGASIVAFGRSLTQSEGALNKPKEANILSSALLKELPMQPSTRLASALLDGDSINEHSKRTVAQMGFFYAGNGPGTASSGNDVTRVAAFALDVGQSLDRQGATRRRDVSTIYQAGLEAPSTSCDDNLEQQLKARLMSVMGQSSQGQAWLDHKQRLYGKS